MTATTKCQRKTRLTPRCGCTRYKLCAAERRVRLARARREHGPINKGLQKGTNRAAQRSSRTTMNRPLRRNARIAYETLRRWKTDGIEAAPIRIAGTRFSISLTSKRLTLADTDKVNPMFAAKNAGCTCGCRRKTRAYPATFAGLADVIECVERLTIAAIKPGFMTRVPLAAGNRRLTERRIEAMMYHEGVC